jgi:hypothetical protein
VVFGNSEDFKNLGDVLWFLGALLAVFILLLPTILVQTFDLKVKNAKPKFIEPEPTKLMFLILPWIVVSAIAAILLRQPLDVRNAEEFFGLLLVSVLIIGVFIPINIYHVYIYTRYKKVVEYNTAEWRRLKK